MVLVVAMIGGLVSCVSFSVERTPGIETETSQMLLNVADEILGAQGNTGALPDEFKAAYELKLPGLTVDRQPEIRNDRISDEMDLTYEGRQYRLYLDVREISAREKMINADDESIRDASVRLLSALSCEDITKESTTSP
ncbi:MAG: hypothetical protein LBH57_09505 [Treponema sp.]|jgi:hypothetical protein|nr:hypothetical protein [Treponema sp.]